MKRKTLLDSYTILEILPNSQRTDANVVVSNKCLTKVTKVKNYCEKYKAKTYIFLDMDWRLRIQFRPPFSLTLSM